MRITILAHGSRGDVQPYLALATGLAQAGHFVRLAAPEIYRAWAERLGLAFAPLAGDPRQLMRWAAKPSRLPLPVRAAWHSLRYVAPVADRLAQDILAASQDADGLIHSLITTALGHQAAHLLDIPDVSALVFPVFTLTNAFPNPLFPPGAIWRNYNLFTHREFNRIFWWGNRLGIHLLRKRVPWLPALGHWPFDPSCPSGGTPVLYGISRHTLPQAAEANLARSLTGYWFLDSPDWQPPARLVEFLSAGEAPVLVGFGSLIHGDTEHLTQLILRAVERTGRRALLGGLSEGLSANLPAWAFPVEDVPFDWLLPHLAAIIHHGGTGTTSAALRAGIPSVTVPFAFDQPFWARQVYHLGAGPAPIPARRLNEQCLAEAIQAALHDPAIHARAAALGRLIRAEDGVTAAVQAIEGHFLG